MMGYTFPPDTYCRKKWSDATYLHSIFMQNRLQLLDFYFVPAMGQYSYLGNKSQDVFKVKGMLFHARGIVLKS